PAHHGRRREGALGLPEGRDRGPGMKITVESTEEFVYEGGRYCRIWRGLDQKGQKVALVVDHLQMDPGADMTEAKATLREVPMSGLEMTWACTKKDIDGKKGK